MDSDGDVQLFGQSEIEIEGGVSDADAVILRADFREYGELAFSEGAERPQGREFGTSARQME